MKKILLLTTGGTIACTQSGDGYCPTLGGDTILSYVPQVREIAQLDTADVLNVDSSNMQPDDWILIAKAIRQHIESYDGIVVLHGTDTMAYTSSALSFMTLGVKKPVVLTGAQIPISQENSDGRRNLFDAICVASNSGLKGVFVVFHGKIMSGCCTSKCDTTDMDAFRSINCMDIGTVQEKQIILHRFFTAGRNTPEWHIALDDRVLLWKLAPGVSPEIFDQKISENYKAIILEAFGIGGLPMLKNSFLPKILEWREKNILTVVTTQCYYGRCDMSIYETGRLALNKGAICAGNMTREAILAKLMWLLSITQDPKELIEMLKENYCGEFGC